MGCDRLATVELRDGGSGLSARWVPKAGMLCCSLRHRGRELLGQRLGVAAYAERGKTMGIPLLYPWANRLAAWRYAAAGRTVTLPRDPALIAADAGGLPIHGVIGGRMEWELDGAGGGSLQARLPWDRARAEVFAVFPYEHELHYAAQLAEDSLQIDLEVHACGADAVPLCFGFHPYLELPGAAREQLSVVLPPMRRLALGADQIPLGPDRELRAQRLALAGRALDDGFDMVGPGAVFAVEGAGVRVELRMLAGYDCAQVYAPSTDSFVCFEPMTAPANALGSGAVRLLAPGERARARFAVSIAELS